MKKLLLILLSVSACLACNPPTPPPKTPVKQTKTPNISNIDQYFAEYSADKVGTRCQFAAVLTRGRQRTPFLVNLALTKTQNFESNVFVQYELENKGLDSSSKKQIRYYRVSKKGVYKKLENSSPTLLEVPFPLFPGKKWKYEDALHKGEVQVMDLVTIKSNGKTYKDCLHLEYSLSLDQGRGPIFVLQTEYRARGLGMVRSTVRYSNGSRLDLERKPGS